MKKNLCKNCAFFNKNNSTCKVIIYHEGTKINLPVAPNDQCHFEELGITLDEIKLWVEDPHTGKRSKEGIVKIEYPENLF